MEYEFSVSFGIGPKPRNTATFRLDLTETEVAYIKEFILKNSPYCDYKEIEIEDLRLFDKINDAANAAVLESINEDRRGEGMRELEFDEVDWAYMSFDFCWPAEL